MIDKEIRFDSGQVLPNKVFQYNYTVVNYDKTELNVKGLRRDVEPVLKERIKTSPEMQILKDNKATIQYKYNDKKGETLFIISFQPEQYFK